MSSFDDGSVSLARRSSRRSSEDRNAPARRLRSRRRALRQSRAPNVRPSGESIGRTTRRAILGRAPPATELLSFLARKLVAKPESVAVELFVDENAQPVIELVVDPEDLGKVIGRSGRVAHALRTLVRASAEGRVSVDILDTDEAVGEQAPG